DRLAGDRLDAQRGAATGVAVELGHDDAVELDGLGELLGDVDGVLAGHRVDDEQDVGRADDLADPDELLHELGVDVQAAAGVDDEHVLAVLLGAVQRPAGDVDGVLVGPLLVDRRTDLAADLDELVDRGGPVHVARGERHARGGSRAWPWRGRPRSACRASARLTGSAGGARRGRRTWTIKSRDTRTVPGAPGA